MFGILDVFLLLALISTIAVTALIQQPVGPEGHMGTWALLVWPCLFVAILVSILVARNLLDFVPGGRLAQAFVAIGILVTFSVVIFGMLVRLDGVIRVLWLAIPYLILAGCAAIIHHPGWPNPGLVRWVVMILLGGAALAGWGLAGTGVFHHVRKDLEQAAVRAEKEREQEDQHEQWEVAEYAKLGDSAPLHALLRFTWSRNDQVRRQASEQVSGYPGLNDKLIELLDQDCEEAVSYIAKVYENPSAKLAPAWGRMLARQLIKWDSLQHDEHAGTWEYNLIGYFKGAQKIQHAGGSLRKELLPWHQHLQKCKGLGSLTAFVKRLLESESQS